MYVILPYILSDFKFIYMKRSKFLSKSDQTIILLSTNNINLTDLMELSDAITGEFSVTDYLELDSHFDRLPV
ncbi:hypothetical protein B0I21_105347 [Sphingobacterium paludis]|uniref:Uncharacterized protein n=1 Tax=Sphingobacterium paludis TaxID=1476465 RepID=A0A4R7CXF5_9SPHI|nr:hypothetical protein B0I21_105347 [Sphingobacterium paludis]